MRVSSIVKALGLFFRCFEHPIWSVVIFPTPFVAMALAHIQHNTTGMVYFLAERPSGTPLNWLDLVGLALAVLLMFTATASMGFKNEDVRCVPRGASRLAVGLWLCALCTRCPLPLPFASILALLVLLMYGSDSIAQGAPAPNTTQNSG